MEPITVNYKVLDARAKVPADATPGAAAADLCAVLDEPLTVQPMQRVLVPTGLAIELPGAHAVALVYARSGLSIKHGLCMANGVGVVDSARSSCATHACGSARTRSTASARFLASSSARKSGSRAPTEKAGCKTQRSGEDNTISSSRC